MYIINVDFILTLRKINYVYISLKPQDNIYKI